MRAQDMQRPTCGPLFMRKSGKPDFRCHPRLACCHVLKTWMPGIKPGMTDEGTVPPRHGRKYSGHPRLACCHVLKAWMPGIKPGMTDEGTVPPRHGRI